MIVRQSFDQRFINKLVEIKDKYGEEMLDLDGISSRCLDINIFTDNFLNSGKTVADISIDANANVDNTSISSFDHEYSKALNKLNSYYIIWKRLTEDSKYGIKRANKIIEACINGHLKIHDQHYFLKSYCYAFSLDKVVQEGLLFIKRIKINRPKHVSSFINLVIQFLAYISNQIAGASAFPDLLIYLDWFCRTEYGNNYLDNPTTANIIKQNLQSLVYSFNFPYRSAGQAAFVNMSVFDKYFLEDLFKFTYYPDNSKPDFESIKKLQRFFVDFFIEEIEKNNQIFTFPIITACLYVKDGQIQDKEFLDFISEKNAKYGFFNIYCGELGKLSSCCRLLNDLNQMNEQYINSFGSGGVSIGSHRVVTINLPRIALEISHYNDNEKIDKFYKKLEDTVSMAQDILILHRNLITELIKLEKLPLYSYGYMHLAKQFSTVGFIGVNECCQILGMDIKTEEGSNFIINVLNRIKDLNNAISKKEKNMIFNIEQIPGESTAYELLKKDKLLFKNLNFDMYSNQYVPLWDTVNIFDRIKLAGKVDKLCSGGAILHINISESLLPEQMKKLIEIVAKNNVLYFAINMNLAKCNTCGQIFVGKIDKSLCHNSSVSNFMRVVGFITPVNNWNVNRRAEYHKRQFYNAYQTVN